jgi:hypothetical protein
LQSSLPEGLSEETLDLVRKVTAPQRHTWRVCQTVLAAIKYVQGHKVDGTPCPITRGDLRAAAQIVELDLHGTGGPRDLGGPESRTVRMSAFRHLGTSRRQAGDGASWTQAAKEALEALTKFATQEDWVYVHSDVLLAMSAEFYMDPQSPIVDCDIDAVALMCRVLGEIVKEDMPFARSFARDKIAELALLEDFGPIKMWDDVLQQIEKELLRENTTS